MFCYNAEIISEKYALKVDIYQFLGKNAILLLRL